MYRRGLWICAAMRPAQAAPQSCAGAPRAVLRTQTLRLEMFQSAAQGIVLRPSERYGTHGHQVLSYTSLQHPRKLQTMVKGMIQKSYSTTNLVVERKNSSLSQADWRQWWSCHLRHSKLQVASN